ncbi:hypothetical protein GCM10022402_16720 [Salinactinospora qingdaonensis]|uniref:Uncharacterized protein n=1 Tax=Salinactinospora qingdaonensis TaxID=702744 RepID=A0ABP7FEF1_9ACTN
MSPEEAAPAKTAKTVEAIKAVEAVKAAEIAERSRHERRAYLCTQLTPQSRCGQPTPTFPKRSWVEVPCGKGRPTASPLRGLPCGGTPDDAPERPATR